MGATRLRLTLGVAWLSCFGCLIGLPINQRRPERDEAFDFFVEDIVPPNQGPVTLSQGDPPDEVLFGVNEVRDPNRDDEIEFEFFFVANDVAVSVSQGLLRVDETATEERGVTVYQPALLVVGACSAELQNSENVTIRLNLSDTIPLDQVPDFGRLEHTRQIVWDVQLIDDCL